MIHTVLAMLSVPTVDIPDISPSFDAPWSAAVQVIISWVLGTAILIALLALIVAIASLALRGVFPEKVQSWAGENLLKIFLAAVALGSAGGLFQFFVNFDFGF